jgi:hypothetical protein
MRVRLFGTNFIGIRASSKESAISEIRKRYGDVVKITYMGQKAPRGVPVYIIRERHE